MLPTIMVRARSSSTTVNTIDIDDEVNLVWEKPKWNVSWGKLSSCFCVRQRQPSKMAKTLEDYEPALYDTSFQINSKQQMGLGRQVDVAPFANARNPGQLGHSLRSWSFGSRGTGTNNGSMSSFSLSDSMSTVSESSSSHLEDAAPARPPGLHSHVRSSSFAVDPSQDLLGSYFLPVAQSQVPLLASCNVGSVHNSNSNSNNYIINGNNNHNNHNAMSTGKPPMISQRHTSLPPRVSAPSIGTPPRVSKNVGVRARCDTGDYSKSSAVTNTSRHRRMNQHFSFCDDSMGDICSKNQHRRVNSFYASDERSSTGVPLSMILCPVPRRPEVENDQSGYISPMEDEYDYFDNDNDDDDASLNMSGFDFDISNDDDGLLGSSIGDEIGGDWRNDDDSHSPFANLSRKVPTNDWTKEWAVTGTLTVPPKKESTMQPTTVRPRVVTPRADEIVKPAPTARSKKEQVVVDSSDLAPVYLRKNEEVDAMFGKHLAVSGWVAVTFGDDSMDARVKRRSNLAPNDMYYLCVSEEPDGSVMLFFSDEHGNVLHSLRCDHGWRCESREISSQIGRCVILRSGEGATLASILPVSLPDCFFSPSSGNLVSEKKFMRLRDRLFAMIDGNGDKRVYAPDEQHDAAMHIMFSLDAMINKIRRFY